MIKPLEKYQLSRLKKGDKKVFDKLFEEHFEELCRYAFLIVKDRDTAEEVVAEVFYRLWSNHKRLNIKVSVRHYLFKSAHNTSLNYLKHLGIVNRHKSQQMLIQKENEFFNEDFNQSPLAILQQKELEAKVKKAIDNLPEQCRLVFNMNRFEGMKYHEIAKELNISISTVKYHMSTALSKLREELYGY